MASGGHPNTTLIVKQKVLNNKLPTSESQYNPTSSSKPRWSMGNFEPFG